MLKSFGVILIYIGIAFFQIPQLAKDQLKKEIWIFSSLMVLVTVVSIAKIYDLPIPNPLELISFVLDPLIGLIPYL